MPYQLNATTWENDADYFQTKVIEDLTMEDVLFYLYIFKHFERGQHGNDECGDFTLVNIVNKAIHRQPGLSESIKNRYSIGLHIASEEDADTDECSEIADQLHEELKELFGETVDYQDYLRFMRMADSYEVFFFETKGRQVTELFK